MYGIKIHSMEILLMLNGIFYFPYGVLWFSILNIWLVHILLYVNDIILTASSDRLRKHFMALLGVEFSMKDLGPLSFFLGIVVSRDANGPWIQ